MQAPDVLKEISRLHETLSKSQQRVVEFLLTQGIEVLYMSSSEIAERIDVNRSTVIRTAQALGYRGFSDLQAALQQHYASQQGSKDWFEMGSNRLMQEIQDDGSVAGGHDILRRMIDIETRKLASLLDSVPGADFDRAVEVLRNARGIYIIGQYLSKSLALNFFYPLGMLHPNCILLEPDTVTFARQLTEIAPGDVLFAISKAPYANIALECMEVAGDAGATVLTLTDSPVSPAAKRADLAFVIPSHLWFYGNSVAPFTLLNALCAALVVSDTDESREQVSRIESIYRRLDILVDRDENT